ncbi:hypothetical protein, variant 5 [Aphanomyces astaci]|uniref:Cyclic nucleotide-binding domain-containing protein n=1 Tax=Aphanomyces astaci TaxID=112090 RepID=W4HA56_APHAT|nr:hypothetical protein, variant 5 [Aphanomyces astaci]ETV88915.1 hypothetical protein, variant 5 [Aphanomyces astaci]|eukprot:XP_009821315.1 hypothetical protein, variant 5 [Aphanomyces astaci]
MSHEPRRDVCACPAPREQPSAQLARDRSLQLVLERSLQRMHAAVEKVLHLEHRRREPPDVVLQPSSRVSPRRGLRTGHGRPERSHQVGPGSVSLLQASECVVARAGKAGHKHAHQVTRKALKAIAIVNTTTTHHVKTSKGVFEDAYETPPSSRSLAQVDILIDQSSRIPSLAKLQHDILHALWRNLLFVAWPAETTVHVCKSTVSMYIVLEGTVTVQTDLHGAKQIQQALVPGSIFSEATISTNLWPHTTLEAMTACRVLTLEHTVYKHTMKKVMMEGAFARALFFTTTGIFAEWTDEQRNTLGVLSENLYYNAGDVVVTEGAPALHLYFVQSGLCGAVRLLGAHQPTHIQVATLSTGDIFGEAAVLDPINGSFQFTIVANTICKIIRIEKNYLNKKNGFELLRLGTITKRILTKIQQFSVRCPQDKLLVQMIRDNCSWKLERKKVLNAFAKDMSKACGKLPRVRSEPQLPKGHKLQFS